MKPKTLLVMALAGCVGASIRADVLELKDGKTLNGKYVGGTAGTIRFETGGSVQVIETTKALALTFTGGGAATAAAAPVAAAPTPAAATSTVSVPAGTTLLVRMVDPVSSRDSQGKRFTTTLETDLVVNGVTAAKAGTKIYGRVQGVQQAGRLVGQSSLDLRLTEIALGPNLVPLVTGGYTDTGARSGRKAVRGAAAGAAIGAIADGGEGAGKGAAIGAAASGLKKGETLTVGPGTMLEFKLQQAVSLTGTK